MWRSRHRRRPIPPRAHLPASAERVNLAQVAQAATAMLLLAGPTLSIDSIGLAKMRDSSASLHRARLATHSISTPISVAPPCRATVPRGRIEMIGQDAPVCAIGESPTKAYSFFPSSTLLRFSNPPLRQRQSAAPFGVHPRRWGLPIDRLSAGCIRRLIQPPAPKRSPCRPFCCILRCPVIHHGTSLFHPRLLSRSHDRGQLCQSNK
jgi:hypothetical protein